MADDAAVTIEALQGQNALLRQILEGAMDSILTVDERGRTALINAAASRAFGYSPDEFLQLTPAALFPPNAPDGAEQEVIRALASRKTWFGEGVARRKDGSTFPALLLLSCADFGKVRRRRGRAARQTAPAAPAPTPSFTSATWPSSSGWWTG